MDYSQIPILTTKAIIRPVRKKPGRGIHENAALMETDEAESESSAVSREFLSPQNTIPGSSTHLCEFRIFIAKSETCGLLKKI